MPLSALSTDEARRIAGVVFDLDDTVLDHGELLEDAYRALFRLRKSGLRLIACTGRPAGWADLFARQWPITAAIAENGAIVKVKEPPRASAHTPRIITLDRVEPSERIHRRARLRAIAESIVARYPRATLADDNSARSTDVTLDINEHCRVDEPTIAAIRAMAHEQGVRTFASSVHVHLTFEADDKASGAIAFLSSYLGEDSTGARARYAYIGDSTNDAAAFAAFDLTFGVANVRAIAARLTLAPRYIAPSPMGAGFTEIANALTAAREEPLARSPEDECP
jgi:HAD superfamily hydrolase (TIGR01484 family)